MKPPKYPNIQIVFQDGNIFALVGTVRQALRENGASPADIDRLMDTALSADSDELYKFIQELVTIQVVPEEDIICPDPLIQSLEDDEDADWGKLHEEEEWDD